MKNSQCQLLNVNPRKWFIALLFGFIFAPAAYIYVGRPNKFWIFAILTVIPAALFIIGPGSVISRPLVCIILATAAFGLWLFIVIDAIRLSRGQSNYKLRNYNSWWCYLILIGVGIVPSFLLDSNTLSEIQAVRTYSIPSSSGLPNLQAGDYLTADNQAYVSEEPRRGELVVFSSTDGSNEQRIYRLIGLPEETIQVIGGIIYINNEPVVREQVEDFQLQDGSAVNQFMETLPNGVVYPVLDLKVDSMGDNTGVFQIPAGHYFVLGDNRDNAADSRFLIGYVPRENITGRLTGVLYSKDFHRIGLEFHQN